MAVESFLQPSDVKITVEKEVKSKPTIAELTTIEHPGRPSSALLPEKAEKRPRKPRKKKVETAEPSEITGPKKEYTLIITEKPQAALKISQALGEFKKLNDKGVSYYEISYKGKQIIVASAVGHLFNLNYKKGQKGWPVFEVEWQPSFTKERSAFTKKYFDLLKKLSRKAKEIVIATDYDIEGEVIGWNVLRFICAQTNAKRMKFSTLTSEELKKSFDSTSPNINWGNAYAGETRHIIDWLYGINLSRALMSSIKKIGSFKIMSIGRVQGPALKIIVDKEKEISSFKSIPYWQVFAEIDWKNAGIQKPKEDCNFKYPKDIFDKKDLDKFKDIKEANAETKKSEEKISPPHPFDLTTLQKEAYRVYKINPSETLSIAQKLYLEGLISYPRTSSQKIPFSIEPKKILKLLEKHFPEAKQASREKPIEGKKSDPAHPSIYPTGEHAQLEERHLKLYQLIVKRFIAAFSSDAVTANKKITLTAINNPEIKFTASGLAILEKGWASFYPITFEQHEIPDLNGKVIIKNIKIEEKMTQPPNRYTPASLISLLEKKNLGTKATRSMIIETLFERGYLDGKSIQATPLGICLVETLEKYSSIIIDENLTKQLEEEMEKIQLSKENFEKKEEEVVGKAKNIINDIAKEFKTHENSIGQDLMKGIEEVRKEQWQNNILMPCPTCKQGNLRILFNKKSRRYFVACSAYPDCRQTFSLPPNALIKKAENNKLCEADNFPKLLAIRKGKRPWEFCFNPECPIEKEKREEWQAKKENTSGNETL
ncbi:MAG: DNA topoisomerase I [Nanoarchaeota archaeon]|mgnify:CR=1 FL=1